MKSVFAEKLDDWQYTGEVVQYTNFKFFDDNLIFLFIIGSILGIFIISNLAVGIYNFLKGNIEKNTSKKFLGKLIGIFNLAIIGISGIIIYKMFYNISSTYIYLFIILGLQIALAIVSIIYSIKNKILSGKIFGITYIMLLIISLMIILISNGFELKYMIFFLTTIIINFVFFIYNFVKSRKNEEALRMRLSIYFLGITVLQILFMLLNCIIEIIIDVKYIMLLSIILLQLILFGTVIVFALRNKFKSSTIYFSIILIIIEIILGIFMLDFNVEATITSNNIFQIEKEKSINKFRENIEDGYLPLATNITYDGVFCDYSFDRKDSEISDNLLEPSYSYAISKDPLSNKEEYYLSLGIDSNINKDVKRKKINLVVLLNISHSMGLGFNSYYYDNNKLGDIIDVYSKNKFNDMGKSKIQITSEGINMLLDELNHDDRFGLVLFEDLAQIAKPLKLISDTDIKETKKHILTIGANGTINFEDGYIKATTLFDEYLNESEYENRIIVLTDTVPNLNTNNQLFNYINENANNNINTSFVGVGVDFGVDLVEKFSQIKGANYYSFYNSAQFKSMMSENFEFMFMPLAFNLKLNLDTRGYSISKVYGVNDINKTSKEIMYINTFFQQQLMEPQKMILVKLKKHSKFDNKLELSLSYEDKYGKEYTNSKDIIINEEEEYYQNADIRKAIVLARYVNLLKCWIMYERTENSRFMINSNIVDFSLSTEEINKVLKGYEKPLVPLTVNEKYKTVFEKFKDYFNIEISKIGDEKLKQEALVINNLLQK